MRHIPLEWVDSTNRYAVELVRQKRAPEGTVISAGFQTQGRGQRGKSWSSSRDENALFSIVYHPGVPAERQFFINQCMAVGVYMALTHVLPNAQLHIKWPNDLYVEDLKVGGLLIQNLLLGKTIETTIAGIGINVNQTTFPDDLPNPVSLCQLTGKVHNVEEIIRMLARSIDEVYYDWTETEVKTCYRENLFRRHALHSFRAEDETFAGQILGTDEDGRLVIKVGDVTRTFNFGEIIYI